MTRLPLQEALRLTLFALATFALATLVTACVSKGKYDKAVDDAQSLSTQLAQRGREASETATRATRLDQELTVCQATVADTETKRAQVAARAGELQTKLDDATAISSQLRSALEKSGKNVDSLLSENGNIRRALDDARARLDELRRAQAAAEARAALFRDLALKFHKMIDAGQLSIVLRDGRMMLRMPNDILFDSGRSEVKPAGLAALKQVAGILVTVSSRRFQIAGHTDNVPIQTSLYPSNWELSSARATAVLRVLVGSGLKSGGLSAAGYGEFDPVAENSDDKGRSKNRRVEITVVPSIDELVAVPESP